MEFWVGRDADDKVYLFHFEPVWNENRRAFMPKRPDFSSFYLGEHPNLDFELKTGEKKLVSANFNEV